MQGWLDSWKATDASDHIYKPGRKPIIQMQRKHVTKLSVYPGRGVPRFRPLCGTQRQVEPVHIWAPAAWARERPDAETWVPWLPGPLLWLDQRGPRRLHGGLAGRTGKTD